MTLSADMRACVDLCTTCSSTCFNEAMNHCLEAGEDHLEPKHFRLMMACAEICRSSATVMLTGVPQHVFVCNACAEMCRACADSCEKVGDMQDCVAICRKCAESCEQMSRSVQKAA
jgi:hypothetical protein